MFDALKQGLTGEKGVKGEKGDKASISIAYIQFVR